MRLVGNSTSTSLRTCNTPCSVRYPTDSERAAIGVAGSPCGPGSGGAVLDGVAAVKLSPRLCCR